MIGKVLLLWLALCGSVMAAHDVAGKYQLPDLLGRYPKYDGTYLEITGGAKPTAVLFVVNQGDVPGGRRFFVPEVVDTSPDIPSLHIIFHPKGCVSWGIGWPVPDPYDEPCDPAPGYLQCDGSPRVLQCIYVNPMPPGEDTPFIEHFSLRRVRKFNVESMPEYLPPYRDKGTRVMTPWGSQVITYKFELDYWLYRAVHVADLATAMPRLGGNWLGGRHNGDTLKLAAFLIELQIDERYSRDDVMDLLVEAHVFGMPRVISTLRMARKSGIDAPKASDLIAGGESSLLVKAIPSGLRRRQFRDFAGYLASVREAERFQRIEGFMDILELEPDMPRSRAK